MGQRLGHALNQKKEKPSHPMPADGGLRDAAPQEGKPRYKRELCVKGARPASFRVENLRLGHPPHAVRFDGLAFLYLRILQ